jgi:hypothetical protein
MQRMQRITGRFLTRTPNEADVEAMLHDFSDSQAMLEKVRLLPFVNSRCCMAERANEWGLHQMLNSLLSTVVTTTSSGMPPG